MRPNVVLIVRDAAPADVFEPYGAPAGSSPTVAQLGRTGTVEHQMYAPSGEALEHRRRALDRAATPGPSPPGARPPEPAADDLEERLRLLGSR